MKKWSAVAGTLAVLVGGALLPAGQAAAAEEGTTIVMPDLVGMSLDAAAEAIAGLSEGKPLKPLRVQARHGSQDPLVLVNWKVCSQYPSAGTELNAKSVTFAGVDRKGTSCRTGRPPS